jgi:hypothetical protein
MKQFFPRALAYRPGNNALDLVFVFPAIMLPDFAVSSFGHSSDKPKRVQFCEMAKGQF